MRTVFFKLQTILQRLFILPREVIGVLASTALKSNHVVLGHTNKKIKSKAVNVEI